MPRKKKMNDVLHYYSAILIPKLIRHFAPKKGHSVISPNGIIILLNWNEKYNKLFR